MNDNTAIGCIVRKMNFGFDLYINACDGSHMDVAWNAMDWTGFGFVCLLAAGFIAFTIFMINPRY